MANAGASRFRVPDNPNGCTTEWDLSGLPEDHVLVDASRLSFPPGRAREDTEMPLELNRLGRLPERSFAYARIMRGGNEYGLRVWWGKDASSRDVDALVRVIRSIDVSVFDSS